MSAKRTLLDIVQDILTDINSDEVNSITDTEDAEQIARIVRSTYRALLSKNHWPHTRRALTINARSDTNFPTHMIVQEELKELASIFYNKSKVSDSRLYYTEITYIEPDEFLRKLNSRDNTAAETDIVIDDSGVQLLIKNDKHPDYYTSFDDVNMVFDSYDSAIDNTLQQSKFQATGYVIPDFIISDSFVPDLPVDSFSLLLEESTSRAQFKMRQIIDNKAEQESARQQRRQSRKNWTVNEGSIFPNYGRK
jgi:hypothetical protein